MADLIISIQYMYDVILEVRGPIPRHVLDVDRMLPSLKFQGPSSRDSKLHLSVQHSHWQADRPTGNARSVSCVVGTVQTFKAHIYGEALQKLIG